AIPGIVINSTSAVQIIINALSAYTGKIGDGKIFVAELQRVIRIRTGEADEAAL
ncbi:P-II family nitrogen regulator, partial [Escherichia sp. HC-CC]